MVGLGNASVSAIAPEIYQEVVQNVTKMKAAPAAVSLNTNHFGTGETFFDLRKPLDSFRSLFASTGFQKTEVVIADKSKSVATQESPSFLRKIALKGREDWDRFVLRPFRQEETAVVPEYKRFIAQPDTQRAVKRATEMAKSSQDLERRTEFKAWQTQHKKPQPQKEPLKVDLTEEHSRRALEVINNYSKPIEQLIASQKMAAANKANRGVQAYERQARYHQNAKNWFNSWFKPADTSPSLTPELTNAFLGRNGSISDA